MTSAFKRGLDRMPPPLRRAVLRPLRPAVRAGIRHAGWLPGRRWLWASVAQAYAWDGQAFLARTTFGASIEGDTHDILEQYVYYFGVWEPDATAWISGRLRPGDVFVDVGANIGYYSLLASPLVGRHGSVVAIEASPRTFSRLTQNLRRNGVTNVRAVHCAADAAEGRVTLHEGPLHHRGLASIVLGSSTGAECVVDARPLIHILTREERDRARLIKIDVEGAEAAVVDGMALLLEEGRPDLEVIVEVDPVRLERQGRRYEELLGIFHDAGFFRYRLRNDYDGWSYLSPRPTQRPTRFEGPLTAESDLVFSRIDADSL